MLEELKKEVCEANKMLQTYKLITFTWGNVSGIDRENGIFAIKPSGVPYEKLTPEDIVLMDLEGNVVEGKLKPSVDADTHLVIYRDFPNAGGVVHTHSPFATAWAQAGRDIPCYGTTHADNYYGPIPCVRNLTDKELENYEYNTGVIISEEFKSRNIDPAAVTAVLCKNHGIFTWAKNAAKAVDNAVVLEEVAKMAAYTEIINKDAEPTPQGYQDKHYFRKHGPNATYGQQ